MGVINGTIIVGLYLPILIWGLWWVAMLILFSYSLRFGSSGDPSICQIQVNRQLQRNNFDTVNIGLTEQQFLKLVIGATTETTPIGKSIFLLFH